MAKSEDPAAPPEAPAEEAEAAPEAEEREHAAAPARKRFGTFQGVYIPSILTILGVIMYLRLGWVVGEAGLPLTLLIITLATAITFITGLSIASTATNMRVRTGGAYFMVSRSFGVESGAAIGLPLYLAQATGVSFYLAGFAESVHPLLPQVPVALIGLAALAGIAALAFISADLALKLQILIFAIIAASLVSLVAGQPVGLAPTTPTELPPVPFWAIFAVFFPAVTGIEAGVSMSGDLARPARSLPVGTIAAVLSGYVIYVGLAVMLWAYAPREVLRGNPMVMWEIAWLPQVMYAGIWGATLSSAMGALLGGARTLQALAGDGVVPRFIGRGSGPGNDPRLATAVTFAIAAGGISAGSLDLLAPVLSMFFLTSYSALNLIGTLEGIIGNPSWRPSFRTPWRLSLLGAALSVGTMLMIDAGASIIAVLACSAVYLFMRRRRMRMGWSDIRGGVLQALARYAIYRVGRYRDLARVWRPHILLFSGAPSARWYLVELADAITQGKGFLTISSIIDRELEEAQVTALEESIEEYLRRKRVPALVRVRYAEDFAAGVEGMVTDYGLGFVEPNTIMMGESEEPARVAAYCRVLRRIHGHRKNLIIVRDAQGVAEQGLPAREERSIDVWFTRHNNNASLMLLLAYMLQSSPEWSGAQLTIRSIVDNEDGRRGVEESLQTFLADSRVEAEVDIMVAQHPDAHFAEIARRSAGTDLVFLGMRAPEDEESEEAYAAYYTHLLEITRAFPLTVLTLAGQEIDFKEVFA